MRSYEQLYPEAVLESLDLEADCRLGQMQLRRRPGQVALPGHGDKGSQLRQVHSLYKKNLWVFDNNSLDLRFSPEYPSEKPAYYRRKIYDNSVAPRDPTLYQW